MRRTLIISSTVTISILIFAIVVFAAATNPQDSYVVIRGTEESSNFGSLDYIEASSSDNFASNPPGCDSNHVIYLRWNLDQVNGAASVNGTNQTNLTLNLNSTFGIGTTDRLKLYKVNNDNWTETTITGDNAPALGDLIEDIAAPTSPGTVVFSNAALADWINENSSYVGSGDTTAGNDIVSFAIRIEGCTSTSIERFDSKETTTGVPPALNIYDPNAVSVSHFGAQNAGNPLNWPMIAGLFALAAVVVAGVGYGVRRFKQS